MFSAVHVADGPLNVYDLEALRQLPVVVVLSSCSVANAKVLQGGSLLGLANAFTTLGASVIAPLTPISDASSVTVMDRLHRQLIAGADPAAALAAATMTHDVADPTAGAFIALGGVTDNSTYLDAVWRIVIARQQVPPCSIALL